MTLAGMIAEDEQALICDMAETYHIFDIRAMPVSLLATLAAGLRDTSRIKMKLAGIQVDTEMLLLAIMADHLALQTWMQTKDGQKGSNRPKSILSLLTSTKKEDDNIMAFETPEAFLEARERIMKAGEINGN